MRRIYIAFLLLMLVLAVSCEKDQARIDDFFLEFATVERPFGDLVFVLDNYRVLVPHNQSTYAGKAGQRVIINYTPLDGDSIKINSISDIYTGEIKKRDNIESIQNDAVKMQSVWVGGDYLNMILDVEFYDKAHIVDLLQSVSSEDVNLYFIHSKNDDPPGFYKKMYLSFSLTSLKTNNSQPINFKLHLKTLTGMQIYNFEYAAKSK